MSAITVRNLPEEVHRALKARAVTHGRSTEAEVRSILADAVAPADVEGIGTRISRIAADVGGFDDLELRRSSTSSDPLDFT